MRDSKANSESREGRLVLLVEDREKQAKMIGVMLEKMGVKNIKIVSNGREAWEIFSEDPGNVALIVSDWDMPEMNGIELLERIREGKRNYDVPFVMITGVGTGEIAVTAAGKGATSFLRKPFTPQQLAERVRPLLLMESGDLF